MNSRYGISVGNIIHPTDFSRGSDVAFAHALKLTLGTKGQLEILHVDRQKTRAKWDNYPSVRNTLEKWEVIPPDSSRGEVGKLGVNISKSAAKGVETATAVLDHVEARDADLIVMATHRREGVDRWLHQSLAERVSNHTDAASLFVPYGVNGFVDMETGAVSLKRVLIPVDAHPDPQPVVEAVSQLVEAICIDRVEIHFLHIGDPAQMPSPSLPGNEKCRWQWETRAGNVVDTICDFAAEIDADLIAMTTNGHDGFLDAVRGSTTERVLQNCKCPVLSMHEPQA